MLFIKSFVFILFGVFCFSYMAFSAELSMREAFNTNDSSQSKNVEKSIAQKEQPLTEKEYYEILDSLTPLSYRNFKRVLEFMNINSFKEYMEWLNLIEFESEIFPISPKKFYEKEWEGWPNGNLRNHNKSDKIRTLKPSKTHNKKTKRLSLLPKHHTVSSKTNNKKTKRPFINRVKKKKWMSFKEAQVVVQKAGIKTVAELREWIKAGKKPLNFPSDPYRIYKEEWVSWYHFLGTEGMRGKDWMSYAEAQVVVQEAGIQSVSQFKKWKKAGNRPSNFPSNPHRIYKEEWVSWYHFLGTEGKRRIVKEWMSYAEAQVVVQKVGIKTQSELREWSKSGNRPPNFPSDPTVRYKKEWVSWYHFLGTEGRRGYKDWMSFEEAQVVVQEAGIKTSLEFREWSKSGKRPFNFPSNPDVKYKKEWKGWPHFLGTKKCKKAFK